MIDLVIDLEPPEGPDVAPREGDSQRSGRKGRQVQAARGGRLCGGVAEILGWKTAQEGTEETLKFEKYNIYVFLCYFMHFYFSCVDQGAGEGYLFYAVRRKMPGVLVLALLLQVVHSAVEGGWCCGAVRVDVGLRGQGVGVDFLGPM